MKYNVALCGLTDHKAHLIQLVISATPVSKYKFHVGQLESLERVDIAIVETMSPISASLLERAQRDNPNLAAVFISDHGSAGASPFRIARQTLLLQIQRLLERAVDEGILGRRIAEPATDSLPARESPTAPARSVVGIPGEIDAKTSSERMPIQLGGLAALVVDDSATVRAQVRAALLRAGIESREAEDAEQALAQLAMYKFDLALLDVVMPGIDGYELCRRLKRDPCTRAMPVLMLTSRSSPFDRARGALVGCDSYLVKPIVWSVFSQAIDKVLSKIQQNNRSANVARSLRGST